MLKGQRENKGFVIPKEKRWSGGVGGGGGGVRFRSGARLAQNSLPFVLRMHGSII